MITSYLQGGVGNQMFQIAAAYSLSKEINVDYSFDFNRCYTPAQGYTSNKYKDNFFKKIKDQNLNFYKFKKYQQTNFSYSKIPLIDNQILIGDFQSEKFFINCIDEIKNLFYFEEDNLSKILNYINNTIKTKKLTSVHVRRGDYLTKPDYHPVCSVEYYLKSMEIVDNGDTEFIFVSDDIEWCKNNFKGDKIHFSPFTNEIDDLSLLMLCDNHIMSNSSFSWWGTYLSGKNGLNVSPKTWFGKLGPQDTYDIYLKDWIII